MNNKTEQYNGVKFIRTDIEEREDFTIAVPAEELVKVYMDQFAIGNVVTSLILCADGTLVMKAKRMEDTT